MSIPWDTGRGFTLRVYTPLVIFEIFLFSNNFQKFSRLLMENDPKHTSKSIQWALNNVRQNLASWMSKVMPLIDKPPPPQTKKIFACA